MHNVPDPDNYSIILRFLGTTPSSSNIIAAFNSIIEQIAKIYDFKTPNKSMNTVQSLKEYLFELFFAINTRYPNKKLVIILDSIDQLSASDYTLEWFIDSLPNNIKMIYSTLPSYGEILTRLRSKSNLREKNFVQIQSLDKAVSITILQDWLKKADRSISKSQWAILDRLFENITLYPLYIKLIFDIIMKWTSFYKPDSEFYMCVSIDKCIEYLFKSMEQMHGKLLFSRAIIYMSSFKNGISENEIEDILSLDDDVLYDIFEFHAPPVRRLPVALWSRIKHDLAGYMVEKEIDDTRGKFFLII